jgi:hypothetical protein
VEAIMPVATRAVLLVAATLLWFGLFNHRMEAIAQEWRIYFNPRFGTTADYPASVFSMVDEPPVNGAGQGFRTRDGRATLSIYGHWNVESETPEEAARKAMNFRDAVYDYIRITDRFYVVSGTSQGNIFYQRCNFSPKPVGIVDCIALDYPAQEKKQWDDIVTRISRSLRAGYGAEPR